MRTSGLDFSGAQNIINPEAELAKVFGQTGSTLDKMITQSAEKKRAEEALKQQAIENQMAQERLSISKEGLLLQQAADKRAADEAARKVVEGDALRTFSQQMGNYSSDIVPNADAMAIQQAYAAAEAKGVPEAQAAAQAQAMVDAAQNRYNADTVEGAQARIDMLSNVAMPSGEYDSTKLEALKEKAIAKPQGTLDAIAAAKAAEEARIQANKDKEALAWQKEQWLRSRPEKETGTIFMSIGTPGTAEYREANVPMPLREALQAAGWSIGKADLAGSGNRSKNKTFNFTDDVKTNARLGTELTEVAAAYGIDERSIQNALNTAKEDQNNLLWWRDIGSSLGLDTEPAKHDVLSRIPSGYVNSTGKTVSIADQEGYLKDAGVIRFKDMVTGTYVNKDATTGDVLSQADVQKRISLLPKDSKNESTAISNEMNASTSSTEAVPKTDTNYDKQKAKLVEYANALSNPNSKEFKDNLDMILGVVSGGGIKKAAQPAADLGILKASQILDKLRGKVTIPGQGFMSTKSGEMVGGSASIAKQKYLKGISDEIVILLSKPSRTPQDVARLKEIANNFPSMKQDIMKYLYK